MLRETRAATEIVDVSAGEYYGKYYQDIQVRVPAIHAAERDLGWRPTTDMDTAIRRTIEFYVKQESFAARRGLAADLAARQLDELPAAAPGSQRLGGGWVVLAAVWFITIQLRPMLDPDEGRYAEIPREMVTSGDWITPRLDGLKYFEKPPLQYWATAALYCGGRALSNWSSRLWTVGLGFACLPLIYGWLRRLYDSRAALARGGVLAMSPYFAVVGHLDLLDARLHVLDVRRGAGLHVGAERAARLERGARLDARLLGAAALAVLTKGIVVFVLAGGTLIAYSWWSATRGPGGGCTCAPGLPLFLALAAPWFILVSRRNADFASFFFVHEHFARFLTKEPQRVEPWWYFLALLLVAVLPWLLPLARAAAAARLAENRAQTFKPLKFLLLFSAVTLVFFSISGSKLAPYILPMFPLLAAFTGVAVPGDPGSWPARGRARRGLALFVAAGLLIYCARPQQDHSAARRSVGAAAACCRAGGPVGISAGRARAPCLPPLALCSSRSSSGSACSASTPSSRRRARQRAGDGRRPLIGAATALYSVGEYRQTIPPYLGRR